jgi:NADH-quinone oxidoreductase subunit G
MKLKIDDIQYNFEVAIDIKTKIQPTILQTCNSLGIKIPRFCYHEALSIAGNCRMCLVEKENTVKPLAACAINISDNLIFFTKSAFVKRVRENVLEFLLINHPLDCPICDQGGECDLQDQSLLYGNDRSRYNESKRAVIDKNCGVFIKTVMTRCIHCTRCVRFLNEITGTSFFGVMGRGSKMEISTYLLNSINKFNEFSGNIIDICPVGALTSKPYAFNSRPWELFKFASINITDPLASYFSIQYKNNKIYRILPYLEHLDFLVTEWIPDNIRFFYDGLLTQRVKKPFFFNFLFYFTNL